MQFVSFFKRFLAEVAEEQNEKLRQRLNKVAYRDSAIERVEGVTERLTEVCTKMCEKATCDDLSGSAPVTAPADERPISEGLRKRAICMSIPSIKSVWTSDEVRHQDKNIYITGMPNLSVLC